MSNLVSYNPQQLELIKRTYAKDLNPNEFDLFVEVSKMRGLSILEKHLFAQVYSKDKADKRQVVFITSIDGARAIAEATGEYRPDELEPKYIHIDGDGGKNNPKGIDSCSVKVYKMDKHGAWYPVTGVARWDEFAKIDYGNLTDMWVKMPYHMIAKCAEMLALRKAFPTKFGGIYTQEEAAVGDFLEGSKLASETINEESFKKKVAHIPSANGAIGLLLPKEEAVKQVLLGKVFETVDEIIKTADVKELNKFMFVNKDSLQTYYKHEPEAAKIISKRYTARAEAEIKNDVDNNSQVSETQSRIIQQNLV